MSRTAPSGSGIEGVVPVLAILILSTLVGLAAGGARSTHTPLASPTGLLATTRESLVAAAHEDALAAEAVNPLLGRVAYTLVAANDSLIQGRYAAPAPGSLSGAVYDPLDGLVYVGDGQGYYIFGIDAVTGRIARVLDVGWGADALEFNPTRGTILAETYSALVEVDPSSGSVLQTFPSITSGAGPSGILYDPDNGLVYAIDEYDSSVAVINASSGANVTNISVGAGAGALAYDPVDHLLFVTNGGYDSVTVVNTSSNTILVHQIKVNGGPACLAYDSENGYLYIGAGDATTDVMVAHNQTIIKTGLSTGACISMIYDPANGHVYVGSEAARIADINGTSLAGTGLSDPQWPRGFAYDPRENVILAANFGDQSITTFNASTEALILGHKSLSETFLRATFDPLNGHTYVATPDFGFRCAEPGTLTVVNSSSRPGILASIPVGYGPEASVVATDSGNVFVANACSDSVTVIDGSTDTVLNSSVPVGSWPIALGYDPVLNRVWVANGYSGNLTVLNGTSGAIVNASVPLPILAGYNNSSLPQQPDGIAVDPTYGLVYVADFGMWNVTILNSSTGAVVNPGIGVGAYPEGILYDATQGTVIVANSGSGNLTILNASSGSVVNASIPAGVGPVAMALDSVDQVLYVADASGGTVTLVNLTTDTPVVSPVQVGSDPQGVSFDQVSQQVDVSDFASGTISILATVPTVSSIGFRPSVVDAGQTAWLVTNASETGGAALSYSYSGLPPGCPLSNQSAIECTPTVAGSYRVQVTATDPMGYSGWQATILQVNPTFSGAAVSATPGVLDAGQPLSLMVTATGGTAPWSFSYWGLPPGCISKNLSTLDCTPTAAGNYTVTAQLTDGAGATQTASTVVSVNPRPSISLFIADPANLTLGSLVTLQAVAIGGTAPLVYSFTGLPPGCSDLGLPTISCTPTQNGTFTVEVNVTDAVGAWATATAQLEVQSPLVPTPLIAAFFAAPKTVTVGNQTTLYAVVTGGTLPFSYAYGGLPTGCSTASTPQLACVPAGAGTFNVTLTVSDSRGLEVNAIAQLVVDPAPSGPGGNHGSGNTTAAPFPWATVILAGATGAVLGGLAGVTLARRRRRGRGPDAAPGEANQKGSDRASGGP